jgi:hypothetical protein
MFYAVKTWKVSKYPSDRGVLLSARARKSDIRRKAWQAVRARIAARAVCGIIQKSVL